MLALSLTQPWADLILSGRKTIELRTWAPKNPPTEFLVHASQKANFFWGKELLPKADYYTLDKRRGAILGKVDLVSIVTYKTKEQFEKDTKKHLAPDYWDENAKGKKLTGFGLENPVKFDVPIPCRGALNFWEVPVEVMKLVK